MREFEVGDLVIVNTGCVTRRVIEIMYKKQRSGRTDQFIRTEYVSHTDAKYNLYAHKWRIASDFHLDPEQTKKEIETMTTLYQTKEKKPRFGTYLAQNSKGQIVLDMKGTGAVEAFNIKDIEEVVPYTVRVSDANSGGSCGHYRAVEGSVEKGDVFVTARGTMRVIVDIDTKNRSANKALTGRKLSTEPLPVVDGLEDDDIDE